MASVSTPRFEKDRLVTARTLLGLTQEELAAAADCSVFSIGKIERGERVPRGPLLRKIADALGQPVSYFFTEAAA